MKDLVEVLLKRRSIRKYKDAAVAEEKLEQHFTGCVIGPIIPGQNAMGVCGGAG